MPATPLRSQAALSVATLLLLLAPGCASLSDAMWEAVGYAKRDLLVEAVEEARDSQQDAKEQFQTALEEFSALTNFDGGDLESMYKKLNGEYEDSKDRAEAVTSRIERVEGVAGRMFEEWNEELEQYSNPKLRRMSQEKLDATRNRYDQLIGKMKKAEGKIEPVLKAFHDQVLILKHSLNAKAIASLKDELEDVENDIASLIDDMQASVDEANEFITELNKEGAVPEA